MLAPHLDGTGLNNNARTTDGLLAWKDASAIYLGADCGFSRTSAGYVGDSDGWQDFSHNGRMCSAYREALDGNVALMGESVHIQGEDNSSLVLFHRPNAAPPAWLPRFSSQYERLFNDGTTKRFHCDYPQRSGSYSAEWRPPDAPC